MSHNLKAKNNNNINLVPPHMGGREHPKEGGGIVDQHSGLLNGRRVTWKFITPETAPRRTIRGGSEP